MIFAIKQNVKVKQVKSLKKALQNNLRFVKNRYTKCSDRWKCNFPPFFLEIMTDRPTNRPTGIRRHGEVTLPMNSPAIGERLMA